MIEIQNLTKKIGTNIILDNISFTVSPGEILGFLGPNGAGKTTTMKIITSFWNATSGVVKVGGIDVAKNSLAVRKKIGYLPENVPLYEDMRVREYLNFVAEIRSIARSEIKRAIEETVARCGLKEVENQTIDELSKGYRQRLGLAQAIIHNPETLILDEPTSGLDPNQIVEIRNLIKELGATKTLIFSTHILSEVNALCDRAVIINKGRIAGEGRPQDLIARAGGQDIIYVKIKGDKDAIIAKLKNLDRVEDVVVKDREADNIYGYGIKSKAGEDLRESLSQALMQSGWSILEFRREISSLEDVFRELTKQ